MFNLLEWNSLSPVIQVHALVAIVGLVLGGVVLVMPKGSRMHRLLGRGFGMAAVLTALTSFFIHEIRMFGLWSPIHLLSIYALWAVWFGVRAIRRGNARAHSRAMTQLYIGGFIIAGSFTFLPGRTMYEVLLEPTFTRSFSDNALLIAWAFPVLGALVALWIYRGPFQRAIKAHMLG